jgi:hypothetical protein
MSNRPFTTSSNLLMETGDDMLRTGLQTGLGDLRI